MARSIPGDDAQGAIFVFQRLPEEEEEAEVRRGWLGLAAAARTSQSALKACRTLLPPLPAHSLLLLVLKKTHTSFSTDLQEEYEEEAPAPPKRGAFSFGTRKIKAAAAEEEEEQAAPARRSLLGTQMLGRKEGLATMAERRYAEQQGSRGTGTRGTSQTQVRKTREEVAAERAAAKAAAEEERRAAREAAAAAKAAAEEERRRAREQQ